jgi:hypothetical protein
MLGRREEPCHGEMKDPVSAKIIMAKSITEDIIRYKSCTVELGYNVIKGT